MYSPLYPSKKDQMCCNGILPLPECSQRINSKEKRVVLFLSLRSEFRAICQWTRTLFLYGGPCMMGVPKVRSRF